MPESHRKDVPGLGNMLFGYALLGLQPVPVSLLARAGVGPAESVFARFSFAAIVIAAVCLARRRGLKTAQPRILALRGVLGGIAVLLYFVAIQNAGAARGTLLNYTYPIWANLIGIALGRQPGTRFWLGLAAALIGVWFVVVPDAGLGSDNLGWGEVAGVASAIFAGAAVLTIKQLRYTDESLTIIGAFTGFGLLMSLPLCTAAKLSNLLEFHVAALAASVGAVAFFGHVFFTRGYRGVSVAHATLLSLLVPVVASLAGIFILGEAAGLRFAMGAALILAASAFVLSGAAAPAVHPPSKSAT